MEILIILIAWFAVGFIYLVNLTASEEFNNLSDIARAILLLIFLPTTIVIYTIIGIRELIKRFKNGRTNKRMQRSNKRK